MSTLVYVLVTVFSTVPSYNSAALVQYQLSELWRQRTRVDVHLFPTLSSPVYPSFAGFPYDNGVGRVHMTSDDVKKFAADLNDTEISSVCSYVYLGSTFYVVNTVPSTDDEVEVSLNLTLMELEAMTDEMITRSMKPSHICRGSDGLHQVVWRGGPKKYLRHYIVQESEIKAILREDIKYGQHGYYPISLQARGEFSHRNEY
ncbi:Beta-lactamase domain-containing protein [Trichostrongylus colubriformis]|uniref:Beta-lactamase domain-containing protein n=1 Tax=Trichostrongylus colubriformis TaxID=6319 RepID=A0AAN8FP68_TRICO